MSTENTVNLVIQENLSNIITHFFGSSEKPLQFLIPLEEQTCSEGEIVTFICDVSRDNQIARWFRDGKEVVPSDKYETTVDGKTHTLTINDATLDDRAEYTVKVGDLESTGPLFVDGKIFVYRTLCFIFRSTLLQLSLVVQIGQLWMSFALFSHSPKCFHLF